MSKLGATPDPPDCNILLIGSTGMGKSTFGNFLNGPDREPIFAMAKDNRPTTQNVNVSITKASAQIYGKSTSFQLAIIDTPGLNESASQDLDHMIKLIQALQKIKRVHACVLVLKFNAKIDAQYKATMQYYCKLLPDLFEKNVIIVMTDFATDERSVRLRERQGVDVEQININTCKELQNCAGNLNYEPVLLTVDCLPYGDEEKKNSEAVRNEFFEHVFAMQLTTLTEFKVAKILDIKNDDAKRIKLLEGEIDGYHERLEQARVESKEALQEVKAKEEDYTKAQNLVKNLEEMIEEKDKDTEVVAVAWSIEHSRTLISQKEHSFHIESPFKKVQLCKWTNGRFKEFNETDRGATGVVQSRFMRRLKAFVLIYTEKRLKYEKEIKESTEKLEKAKLDLEKQKELCDSLQEEHEKYKEQIVLLRNYIEEKREHIRKYSSDFLTLEEAQERLQDLITLKQ